MRSPENRYVNLERRVVPCVLHHDNFVVAKAFKKEFTQFIEIVGYEVESVTESCLAGRKHLKKKDAEQSKKIDLGV